MSVSQELLKLVEDNPAPELDHDQLQILSVKIKHEIDVYSKEIYRDDFRWHLGASVIGHECDRKLWLGFHWVTPDNRDGRMSRLHERGKEEEAKFAKYLRGIGFTLWDKDPSTGKQFIVSYHNGHFGGSSDGVISCPPSWNIPGIFLPEFKTSATGSKFSNLNKDNRGIEQNQEQHFVQQSIYGYGYGIRYGLYAAVNKNDDDIYYEFNKLSVPKAEAAIRRAGDIITSDYMPAMMPGAKESFFKCKMCEHSDFCHKGVSPAVNCRSCVYAEPVQNAEWRCNKYGQDIPRDYVAKGCDGYKALA